LKLGLYDEALKTVEIINDRKSESITETQIMYLHAVCLKINKKYSQAAQFYNKIAPECRRFYCEVLRDITCSIMVLPL